MSSLSKSHTDFPLSGVFHVLDDTDPNSSLGTSENDSVSTNGSCGGEAAEDPAPCKVARYIPGLDAAPSKQEKTRLKNERKHQRQKERKAKELVERCHGLLMNRKLEKLAEKLVSMGFPREKATIALIMHEGDVEGSINFLVENGRVSQEELHAKALKVDISEEVSRMADLEQKLGYSAVEVQRAVVACEGDIDHALSWLRKHSPGATPSPPEHHRRASPTPPPRTAATSFREPGTFSAPNYPVEHVASYREPGSFSAPNYPIEHAAVHYREPGTIPSPMSYGTIPSPVNYRREPGRPVSNYLEPPGVVSSTSPRGPGHFFPAVSNGESSPRGGSLPHLGALHDPTLPRTQLSSSAPFDIPAWTMREMPRRNVYADWKSSHPASHHPSMNRLEENGTLMHELYALHQKPRTPPLEQLQSQSFQWPEVNDRARLPPPHDRLPPGVYNRAPSSPFTGPYDRILPRGAVAPGRSGGWSDWNVERSKSVDYKSIDWSVDGKLSLSPVTIGWSGTSPRETRPFTKDILPTVL